MNSSAVEHASEIMEANGSLPVTYDAFISYSHAKDKPLAMALQAVVQRLGKPWYRRRALRLFRDDTSLSATPKLWPSIKFALAKSRFLILLASPEAAVSHWVGQEVAYWLDHNGTETLLIALTEGELTWDIASRDFLWSQLTPLPAVLKNRFSTEPRWIDLRGRREAGSAKGPDFVDLAADFAAAIHGTAKEDLLSQEVRQQRRALTLAWSAAALLFVLVVAAAGLAAFGFNRAQEAARERDLAETSSREAERQRDIAVNKSKEAAARLADAQRSQSRFLADAARQENKTGDHATALALALEALPDPSRGINRPYVAEAEKELFAAQNDVREVAEFHDQLEKVNSVVFSPDGKRFLTTSDYNVVLIWNSAGGKFISLMGHSGPVTSGSFSPDGNLVVTGSQDKTARVWDASSGKELFALTGHGAQVNSVGFSNDGKRVVTASGDGTARIWDLTTRKTIQTLHHATSAVFAPDAVTSAAFSPDGLLVVTAGDDEKVLLWETSTGRKIAGLAGHEKAVRCAAFSLDGRKIATASADRKVRLFDADAGGGPVLYPSLVISGHDDAVEFSCVLSERSTHSNRFQRRERSRLGRRDRCLVVHPAGGRQFCARRRGFT